MATDTQTVDAKGGHDQITRWLLAGGVVGPLLFIVVFLIEEATRPGYNPWRNFVSQLGLSDQGWEQIASFLVYGVLCLGFAIGLRRVLRSGRGAIAGPILLGIYSLALIVAGIFVTDPGLGYPPGTPAVSGHPTTHGAIHAFAGLVVFVSLTAACFVLAWRFAGTPGWRGWALYSVVTGIVVLVAFVVSVTPNMPAGIIQRIAIIVGWIWLALTARRLLRQAREQEQGSGQGQSKRSAIPQPASPKSAR